MSAISTARARIDRWDNGRPAHREQACLIEALKLERSSRYLCSQAFITFMSKPHDDDAALILAPYRNTATSEGVWGNVSADSAVSITTGSSVANPPACGDIGQHTSSSSGA